MEENKVIIGINEYNNLKKTVEDFKEFKEKLEEKARENGTLIVVHHYNHEGNLDWLKNDTVDGLSTDETNRLLLDEINIIENHAREMEKIQDKHITNLRRTNVDFNTKLGLGASFLRFLINESLFGEWLIKRWLSKRGAEYKGVPTPTYDEIINFIVDFAE